MVATDEKRATPADVDSESDTSKASAPPDSDLIGSVARDLELVARLRSFKEFRDAEMPALERLCDLGGSDRISLASRLERARGNIVDKPLREATEALYPFPLGEIRWPPLMARVDGVAYTRALAKPQKPPERCVADSLGDYWNGLSARSPKTGRRKIDVVFEEFARAVLEEFSSEVRDLDAEKVKGASGSGRKSKVQEEPPSNENWTRSGYLGASAAVVALVIALVSVLIFARTRSAMGDATPTKSADATALAALIPGEPPGTRPTCAEDVGALDAAVAKEANADSMRIQLRAAYREAGGSSIGCPSGPATRWGQLITQELRLGDQPTGVLIYTPSEQGFHFSTPMWGGYTQIGAKDRSLAQSVGGLPKSISRFPDGHVEVELSSGTLMVAEREDAPYFWLAAPYVIPWRAHPELGLPMGNPQAVLRQDFQYGYATVNAASLEPTVHLEPDPGLGLPPRSDLAGAILRESDATSWWISPRTGERFWIPDGSVWECLGGQNKVRANNVPGYAVATLRYGGIANCQQLER